MKYTSVCTTIDFVQLISGTWFHASTAAKNSTQKDLIHCIAPIVADRRHTTPESARKMSKKKCTDRTMILYHVTVRENWFPIQTLGLLTQFNDEKVAMKGIFLVSKDRVKWAMDHVSSRHGRSIGELIVVTVRVRRSKLRKITFRTVKNGVWLHRTDILPCRIESLEYVNDD